MNEVPIDVLAAGIKQLDRAVAGTHYSSPKQLPIVPGTDGVGRTADGQRVYFAFAALTARWLSAASRHGRCRCRRRWTTPRRRR
ncbi:hypothetical protein M8494_26315 [Serratia ureilytica]